MMRLSINRVLALAFSSFPVVEAWNLPLAQLKWSLEGLLDARA